MNLFHVYTGPGTLQTCFAEKPHYSVKELFESGAGPSQILRSAFYASTTVKICVVTARPGAARVTISNGGIRAISAILVAGLELTSEMNELARFACEMRLDPVIRESMHSAGKDAFFNDLPTTMNRPMMAKVYHAKTCDCETNFEREPHRVVDQALKEVATVYFRSVSRNIS